MKALALINQFPSTRVEMDAYISKALDEILNSNEINPVDIETKLKVLETIIDGIRKNPDFKAAVLHELRDQTTTYNGFKITKTGRTNWEYDHCEQWKWHNDQRKLIEKKMQIAHQEGCNFITQEGEIVPPAIKTFTEFLKIEFDKK